MTTKNQKIKPSPPEMFEAKLFGVKKYNQAVNDVLELLKKDL